MNIDDIPWDSNFTVGNSVLTCESNFEMIEGNFGMIAGGDQEGGDQEGGGGNLFLFIYPPSHPT